MIIHTSVKIKWLGQETYFNIFSITFTWKALLKDQIIAISWGYVYKISVFMNSNCYFTLPCASGSSLLRTIRGKFQFCLSLKIIETNSLWINFFIYYCQSSQKLQLVKLSFIKYCKKHSKCTRQYSSQTGGDMLMSPKGREHRIIARGLWKAIAQ